MSELRNQLKSFSIRGLFLAVAATTILASEAPHAATVDCGAEYVVRSGDSMGRIAKRCGYSAEEIMNANRELKNPNQLRIGQRLAMPGVPVQVAADAKVVAPEIRGKIINGRRCALLETADGTRYGLVNSNLIFVSGHNVAVTGKMVRRRDCEATNTLVVREMKRITN